MAAISNQPEPQGFWARLGFTWDGIAEHRPVSGLTVWLLKLAAISSALVLFFAAVIIGISVTDPAAIAPQGGAMHFANMAMSFGVDGALPGLFFTAVEAWQQERRGRSTWLFTLVFCMLTTAFVGYCVSGQSYEPTFAHPLLVAKCMVAILYVMSVTHQVKQNGLNVTQVATLEQRMQEMVAQIQATSSQTVSDLKASISAQVASEVAKISADMSAQVAQNLATLHDSVAAEVAQKTATIGEGVAAQIAQLQYHFDDENAQRTLSSDQDTTLLSEQIGQLVGLVNDQAHTIQHLTNELAGVRREVRTTVTEIRSFAQEMPALPVAAPTIVDASSEPGERVRAFLQHWSSPKRPTIQAIMDACQVAKKTATRYREDFYGLATGSQNDDEE